MQGRIRNGELEADEMEVLKAAVIQNFEFTYELCWKFIKRWLDANYSGSFTSGLSRRQLFRSAAENRLIDNIDEWFAYHELRNRTLHTYDRTVADEIYSASESFWTAARELLHRLEASDV